MKKCETLYVIDDDDIYRFIIEKTIKDNDLVNLVKVFPNGREAIDFLESAISESRLLPEIILLDLTMPVMDGWEFLENYLLLKPRIGKRIHIYVVSSSINPADVERAKNISDVTDYAVKPITKEKLVDLFKFVSES
jgi:CheY-like chemotaxis protein